MLRRTIIKPMFEIALRIMDDAVPVVKIKRFLVNGVNRVGKLIKENPRKLNAQDIQEYHLARARCAELGLPTPKIDQVPDSTLIPAITEQEFHKWLDSLSGGKIITRNRIISRSGKYLLFWINQSTNEKRLEENMEDLLRHVEVKRKDSLLINPHAKSSEAWLEKHTVSIAFSVYARKTHDFRFLNAAFKLNDWAYPNHKRQPVGRQLIRYLWALAEAETSARELFD